MNKLNKLKIVSISLVLLICFAVTSKVWAMDNQMGHQIVATSISEQDILDPNGFEKYLETISARSYINGYVLTLLINIKEKIEKQQLLQQEEQRKMGLILISPKQAKFYDTRFHLLAEQPE